MKKACYLFFAIFSCITVFGVLPAGAQCAACTAAVETSSQGGSHATAGLNAGIMYLLAAPYLVVAVGGYIWYKKYRRRNVVLDLPNEKLNLN
ncbi:hypothetical protein [Mucilaginibacter psychrotolerans]|uniref:Uncharacterized protein n=1 Tax=Mucilaginibacter psychrotolerans TaxID=1524096 RepID=A0A4Y8SII6_9SPHI|nr:hypothetical protein [Mucilaginibacter psychrotolerans]TFF38226.1 hypothetical protein E2R66_09315 [Mucilaginibacter psychrotolerans]